MCKETTHANLTQPDHFMRHAIKAERYRSERQRYSSIGQAAIDKLTLDDLEQAKEHAHEALLLADANTTPECIRMLQSVEQDDLTRTHQLD